MAYLDKAVTPREIFILWHYANTSATNERIFPSPDVTTPFSLHNISIISQNCRDRRLDDPRSLRHSHRTTRLHLAFLREVLVASDSRVLQVNVEGERLRWKKLACTMRFYVQITAVNHIKFLCTARTVGTPVPTKSWVFVRKIKAVNHV